MPKVSLPAYLGPARPPFLLLTLSCVALGAAVAWRSGGWGPDQMGAAVLALIGGLAAHVAVNALNEYMDFRSGLDMQTQRTPFSGGSGVLPAHPELARYALVLGAGAAAMAVLVGAVFLWWFPGRAWALLPCGLTGLALVVLYTPWITQRAWWCLVAPGVGFGPVMVLGTEAALTGRWTMLGVCASMVPFFLVNNLLLLNQFPDVEPDRHAGRRTLPMVKGLTYAVGVLGVQWLLALGVLAMMWWEGWLPRGSVLAALGALAVVGVWLRLHRYAQVPEGPVPPGMPANVLLAVGVPFFMAVAIALG
ncbi:MAG TPA: prenyltransferase [Aquabacterium sp.]|nr:prenyltransferase [Aquabacterium sp.]